MDVYLVFIINIFPFFASDDFRQLHLSTTKTKTKTKTTTTQQTGTNLFSDLSYNKITGSLTYGDFLNQPNLIDLYLGFNQIQSIDERAFVGLKKLQVLELNNNNLKQIHSNALIPIQSSIYELNLSNNNRLTSIPTLGVELLISFKSYGNEQLRQLPVLKSAKSLALTYAYHCCDYLPSNNLVGVQYADKQSSEDNSDSYNKTTSEWSPTLVSKLINSFLVKLGKLFPDSNTNETSPQIVREFSGESKQHESSLEQSDSFEENLSHSDNFTELVIWPQVGLDIQNELKNGGRGKRHNNNNSYKNHLHHNKAHFKHNHHIHGQSGMTSWHELEQTGSERVSLISRNYLYMIDDSLLDLILQEVRQIRIAHNVWMSPGSESNQQMRQSKNDNFREVNYFSRIIATRKKRYFLPETTNPLFEEPPSIEHLFKKTKNFAQVKCLPEPSAFFPCQDLFDTWWLRVGIWSVFLLAFTGNILVIIVLSLVRPSSATSALTSIMWLAHSKRHIDVPRFLVINLAIADLLMAIYLGLLAFVDISTLGRFKLFAIKWQYSTGCKLAGFLGVLSSELSVFILAIITLERNYAITNAVHLNRRLSLQKAMVIMFIGYTFALSMAIMPLNGISDYKKFSICLPLDIDSNLSSQIYIISLISINTFSFILLLSCYLRMYCAIRGSQAWNTNDLRIAKRMSILVITDFLCWMPIIIVAIATLFGYHIVGRNGIKILTIFILPLNSVANPFLYAITTKKFKRDLNTLIRRTRSSVNRIHICNKGEYRLEDPKIFIGNYNEYQHNLMLNQKKQNKKNLLANELIKHQQQQQMMMLNRKNNPRKHHRQDRFNLQVSSRPFAHNTANQVTINRTSCSCQRNLQENLNQLQLRQRQHRPTTGSSSSIVIQVNAHMKPKIVLDSVEADSFNDKINESFDTLRDSSSNNYTKSCLKPESEKYLKLNQAFNKNLNCSTFESENTDRLDHGSYLRPKSDEICDRRQPAICPIGSSCHAIIGCQFEANSSQGDINQLNRGKTKYLNVLDSIQQDQTRSASACGYSTITKKETDNQITTKDTTLTGGDEHHHGCNIKGTKVCGSCDTIQVKKGSEIRSKRSSEKLSQSINRLLFNPIAKAWSSIQISLSSSASHVAAIATGKQSSSRLDDREEQSATDTTTTPKKEFSNNSTTIEEILLLSSPLARPFASERRMSRSCDLGSQQYPTCFVSTSSSMAGGSSQCDYDDDQRILLATINRIAANRESVKRRMVNDQRNNESNEYADYDDIADEEIFRASLKDTVVKNMQSDKQRDSNHRQANHQRKLSRSSKQRFNRCRSWSPALLSKLEDCIHQIKHKIPKFNVINNTTEDEFDEHNLDHQTVHESTNVHSSCCPNDVNDPLIEQNPGEKCFGSEHHAFERQGEESETEEDYDNDISEIDPTDEGDMFDEGAIDGWSERKKRVLSRRHARRLSKFQQQSSTNSDTLSTRTGTTMVTNMSLSFDDAANSSSTNQLNSAG